MRSLQTGLGWEPLHVEKLLIVEADASIRWALRGTLQSIGFDVIEAASRKQAIALVRTICFDAVLLDTQIPKGGGFQTCEMIRELSATLCIVMLSTGDSEEDRIRALGSGANDCVNKPFSVGDIEARIRSALGRDRLPRRNAQEASAKGRITIGDVELDPFSRLVSKGGKPIQLTSKQYDLLYCLMANAGDSLTHAQLLSSAWGPKRSRAVLRSCIMCLRKKLGEDASYPRYLFTDSHAYRFASRP